MWAHTWAPMQPPPTFNFGLTSNFFFVYRTLSMRQKTQNLQDLQATPTVMLKVPKRENFSLAFFALSEPIWVCELGTGEKNRIFYRLTPDFDGFWFFAAY